MATSVSAALYRRLSLCPFLSASGLGDESDSCLFGATRVTSGRPAQEAGNKLTVCTEGSPATEGCFSQRSAQPCNHGQHTNHALARAARLGLCLYRPSVQKPLKKERKKHSAASFGDKQAQLHRVGHPSHCFFLPQVVQMPGEATSHPRPLHPAPARTENNQRLLLLLVVSKSTR